MERDAHLGHVDDVGGRFGSNLAQEHEATKGAPESGADAWLWSPAGRSRILFALFALGLMTAGTMILMIAGTDVFVPQDLEFLGRSPGQLNSLDPHLISLMAHDRAGFGGAMLALGISFLATSWKALRPQAKGAWRILGIAGGSLVVPAFVAHWATG